MTNNLIPMLQQLQGSISGKSWRWIPLKAKFVNQVLQVEEKLSSETNGGFSGLEQERKGSLKNQ